ncbi:hypothetical protein D3C73_1561270 [compost metagenome]
MELDTLLVLLHIVRMDNGLLAQNHPVVGMPEGLRVMRCNIPVRIKGPTESNGKGNMIIPAYSLLQLPEYPL